MFVHCITVEVIFIVRSHMYALNIKAVLAVTRSITYTLLFCIYSFRNF